jgi:hypothetical protein
MTMQTLQLAFDPMVITNEALELGMCYLVKETDHKHMYKFSMKYSFMSTIMNVAIVWNFQAISDKCNIVRTYTTGNFAYKCITKK